LKAKIMAHAMKIHPQDEIEIWQGDALVYERPLRHLAETEGDRPA
jgi:hypothetical protein